MLVMREGGAQKPPGMSHKPVIHVLTGCTAVGKTELALRWAEAHGAEIVSCDSMLFYRGMDIGTAKPTRGELARVPHHLIDICEPDEAMDIARYVTLARAAVKAIASRGRAVLVTGGSGFYLKAFFAPVTDAVAVPAEVRGEVARLSAAEALGRLGELNPSGLEGLDAANPRRVARALERCLASGRTLAELRDDFDRQPAPFAGHEVKFVELVRAPEDLANRIEQRVTAMLAAGLVNEVRGLLDAGLRDNPSAAGAIGYREVIALLEGRLTENELAGAIVKNTRGLVKKQRTWFRTQLPPHAVVEAANAAPARLFSEE
jgi:tRNA dimethylallyltransferase